MSLSREVKKYRTLKIITSSYKVEVDVLVPPKGATS